MAYLALYRRFRPQDFDNLVGQEHINITLKNAIATGKIAHAYLFAGPRGTGKTSMAKILAKALNCAEGPTDNPCNRCANCERITNGSSMDVFEIDAASNRGIDEIRDLRETVKFAPVEGRTKVYIIDEVHMLTTEAFNALLKTLEEPPGHVVFILATTEPHRIPATIHSRCQRYDFHRIGVREIEDRLAKVADQSGINIDSEAVKLIAVHADGGMRDALSILDQCASLDVSVVKALDVRKLLGLVGHEWVWRLADAIALREAPTVLTALDEMIALGKDGRQILIELALHMRSLMLYKAAPELDSIEMYSDNKQVLAEQSAKFTHSELVQIIQMLHEAANDAKWSPEPRITVEMALLSICRRSGGEDLAALLERVTELEKKLSGAVAIQRQEQQTAPAFTTVTPSQPAVSSAPSLPAAPAVQPGDSGPNAAGTGGSPLVAAANAAPVGDITAIWDAVLRELMVGGKRAVHACVNQGQLVSMDDKVATVRFTGQFAKDRTEKEDFRAIIEKLLAQVSGRQVRLQCVLGAAPAPPAAKKEESDLTPQAERAHADHPAVKKALEMFGGKIV